MHIFFSQELLLPFSKESKQPFNQSAMHINTIVLSSSRNTGVSGPASALTEVVSKYEDCRNKSLWQRKNSFKPLLFPTTYPPCSWYFLVSPESY